MSQTYDAIIIGAGAAGLMCAGVAGERGLKIAVIDHAKKAGEKIRISGGGRCNFTNLYTSPENFLSQNPHFCKSALKQYTQYDFIDWVEASNIAYHEKKLGQLFCDHSAGDIIHMLVNKCNKNNVDIHMQTSVQSIKRTGNEVFTLQTSIGEIQAKSLVVACGGLSIPKIGASGFGYDIARQFGHDIVETRAGLVPLTFTDTMRDRCKDLSGLSVEADVKACKASFAEGLLFTHRGLSGPSILQISSYWKEGQPVTVNMAPETDILAFLKDRKLNNPKQDIGSALAELLPKRLVAQICDNADIGGRLADLSNAKLDQVASAINHWQVTPNGTEGYRTAEVTLGGVSTKDISSKTFESNLVSGLYFIGEVLDVTGWLGGYNFQWAWSSGYVAGINI